MEAKLQRGKSVSLWPLKYSVCFTSKFSLQTWVYYLILTSSFRWTNGLTCKGFWNILTKCGKAFFLHLQHVSYLGLSESFLKSQNSSYPHCLFFLFLFFFSFLPFFLFLMQSYLNHYWPPFTMTNYHLCSHISVLPVLSKKDLVRISFFVVVDIIHWRII